MILFVFTLIIEFSVGFYLVLIILSHVYKNPLSSKVQLDFRFVRIYDLISQPVLTWTFLSHQIEIRTFVHIVQQGALTRGLAGWE